MEDPDPRPNEDADGQVRLVAFVRGEVQGVGFRWWTRSQALALGVQGHATNLSDGRVEVQAQGRRAAVEELLTRLRATGARSGGVRRPGRVDGVTAQWLAPVDLDPGFVER